MLTGLTLPLAPTGRQAAVVREVRPATGGLPIEPDTVVLNGPAGTPLDALKPGDPLPLTFSITPGWENVREAIGGREFIVQDGVDVHLAAPADRGPAPPEDRAGHHGDGRPRPRHRGRAPVRLQRRRRPRRARHLMLSRGVVQALNMDGGGSTTMDVRLPGDTDVSLVNRPSGGSEVAVANSLIVFSSVPTGPLATLDVHPGSPRSGWARRWVRGEGPGRRVQRRSRSPPGTWRGPWSGPGAIAPAGRYSATAAGTATVVATARGIQGTATITVRLDTFPPVARAPASTLVAGDHDRLVEHPGRRHLARGDGPGPRRQGVPAAALRRVRLGGVPLASATDTSVTLMLAPGVVHRLRVRAIDRAGNVGAWAAAAAFRLASIQESAAAVIDTGHWTAQLSRPPSSAVTRSPRRPQGPRRGSPSPAGRSAG